MCVLRGYTGSTMFSSKRAAGAGTWKSDRGSYGDQLILPEIGRRQLSDSRLFLYFAHLANGLIGAAPVRLRDGRLRSLFPVVPIPPRQYQSRFTLRNARTFAR